MTSPTDIQAIEQRVAKATAWKPEDCGNAHQGVYIGDMFIVLDDTYENCHNDWQFIAHARTDIPRLLEDRRKHEKRIAALTDCIELRDRERTAFQQQIAALQKRVEDATRLVDRLRDYTCGHSKSCDCETCKSLAAWEQSEKGSNES